MINYTFADKQAASKVLGRSPHTLDSYRKSGRLIEGIHWKKDPDSPTAPSLYNIELCKDWIQNLGDPAARLRAIQDYCSTLPSEQRRQVMSEWEQAKTIIRPMSKKQEMEVKARAELYPDTKEGRREATEDRLQLALDVAYSAYEAEISDWDSDDVD